MHKLNNWIYDTINANNMPTPDLPVHSTPTYSQCYEDVIMESLIAAFIRQKKSNFVFVEIGANHPVSTSSSYLFRTKYGMKSILVEANPKLISALSKFRPNDLIISAAVVDNDDQEVNFFVSQNNETSSIDDNFVKIRTPGIREIISVPTIRINSVLETANQYGNKIILSVDVEAYDLPILKDINYDMFRPLLVLVEPSEDYQPGSINNIINFMKEKNYNLIAETRVNLIFKDNEEIK